MGVAVGAGGTGVAVGVGVGVGLEQAAMSAASANKIVHLNSFDMKAAKLLRLGVIPTGGRLGLMTKATPRSYDDCSRPEQHRGPRPPRRR